MTTSTYISATIPPATAAALEREAKERGIKMSPLVREVLTAHVQRQQGQKQQKRAS